MLRRTILTVSLILLLSSTGSHAGREDLSFKELEVVIREKVLDLDDIPINEMTVPPLVELNYLCTEAYVRAKDKKKKKVYRDNAIRFMKLILDVESTPQLANTLNSFIDSRKKKEDPKKRKRGRKSNAKTVDFSQGWAAMVSNKRGVKVKPREMVKTFGSNYEQFMYLRDVSDVTFCIKTGDFYKKRAEKLERKVRSEKVSGVDLSINEKAIKKLYGEALDRYLLAYEYERGLNERLDIARSVVVKNFELSGRREEQVLFVEGLLKVYPDNPDVKDLYRTTVESVSTNGPKVVQAR